MSIVNNTSHPQLFANQTIKADSPQRPLRTSELLLIALAGIALVATIVVLSLTFTNHFSPQFTSTGTLIAFIFIIKPLILLTIAGTAATIANLTNKAN